MRYAIQMQQVTHTPQQTHNRRACPLVTHTTTYHLRLQHEPKPKREQMNTQRGEKKKETKREEENEICNANAANHTLQLT